MIHNDSLLQNVTKAYYKMCQVFYYKMCQWYYKMRQLLQNEIFITNYESKLKNVQLLLLISYINSLAKHTFSTKVPFQQALHKKWSFPFINLHLLKKS